MSNAQVKPNKLSKIILDLIAGANADEVRATVKQPSGAVKPLEIRELSDHVYEMSLCPSEEGLHVITVKVNDHHVAGSPFSFTVGKMNDMGAHRIRANGSGLHRAEVNKPGALVYTVLLYSVCLS